MEAIVPLNIGTNTQRLREFITRFARIVEDASDDAAIQRDGSALLAVLLEHDDWLDDEYARPDPQGYTQYLLHCDSLERFSIVSFVWGPGQATPVHDHRVWGIVGVLRGAELVQPFVRNEEGALVAASDPVRLEPGKVEIFGPAIGDIHRVANAHDDRVSISIHIYGGNIGAIERATYDAAEQPKRFISGYANARLPNIWDKSAS